MSYSKSCPVPLEQRPIEEFKKLKDSWFFAIPINNRISLYLSLVKVWAITMPISMLIASGSYELKSDFIKLLITSAFFSTLAPFLILIRQWLGWKYIMKRLISEKVEYEESGWYDGQIWQKNIEFREKDLLVAFYEVKPIIMMLSKALYMILYILTFGLLSLTLPFTIIPQ